MATVTKNNGAPARQRKKTSIGESKNTKYKNRGSGNMPPKGYRKKYRGQGKK